MKSSYRDDQRNLRQGKTFIKNKRPKPIRPSHNPRRLRNPPGPQKVQSPPDPPTPPRSSNPPSIPPSYFRIFHLPRELIRHIFSLVGHAHFNYHPRNLTLCKAWYIYAREVLETHLDLELVHLYDGLSTWLPRVLIPAFVPHHSAAHTGLLRRRKSTLRSLSVTVRNQSSRMPPERTAWIVRHYQQVFQGRPHDVEDELKCALSFLKQCSRLRYLHVGEDLGGQSELSESGEEIYLEHTFLPRTIQLESITVMDLDLLAFYRQNDKRSRMMTMHTPHMCLPIAKKLPRLRSLRLRTQTICPEVFAVGKGETCEILEEVILDLIMPASVQLFDYPHECPTSESFKNAPCATWFVYFKQCVIEPALRSLAARCPRATRMRAVSDHFVPRYDFIERSLSATKEMGLWSPEEVILKEVVEYQRGKVCASCFDGLTGKRYHMKRNAPRDGVLGDEVEEACPRRPCRGKCSGGCKKVDWEALGSSLVSPYYSFN